MIVRSRSDGAFEAEYVPDLEGVHLRASKPGFVTSTRFLASTRLPDERLRVVLVRGQLVKGRLLTRDRIPVAGATVAIGPFASSGRRLVLSDPDRWGKGAAQVGISDARGSFEIPAPPGRHDLAVQGQGIASTIALRGLVTTVDSGPLDLGDVEVLPEVSLAGVVVAADGAPVAGASIAVAGLPDRNVFESRQLDYPAARWSQTSIDGTFELGGLVDGAAIELHVSHPDFVAELRQVEVSSAERVVVELASASTLRGRVTDEAGEPIEGALVSAHSSGRPKPAPLDARTGRTDQDGAFVFRGLEPGRVAYEAWATGFSKQRGAASLEPNRVWELDLVLRREERELLGRVTSEGRGVGDAEILVDGAPRTRSQSDGRFEIRGSLPDAFDVTARSSGLERSKRVLVTSARMNVRLELSRSEVSGTVVEGGLPVADVVVTALEEGAPFQSRVASRADVGGRFSFELPQGRFRLRAAGPSARDDVQEIWINVGNDPIEGLEIELPTLAALEGEVLGLDSTELIQLSVAAIDERLSEIPARWVVDGRYRIEGLRAGDWLVVGTVAGSGHRAEARAVLKPGDDQTVDLVFGSGYSVRGSVTLDGTPWPGSTVFLIRGEDLTSLRKAWTDRAGAFSFYDVAAGNYVLACGATMQRIDVDRDRQVPLFLESAEIAGRIIERTDGLGVGGVVVKLWPSGLEEAEATAVELARVGFSDAEGRFAFGRVPTGDYELLVVGEQFSGTRLRIRVGHGTEELLVRVARVGS
jgi:hypothetical protein